MSSGKLPVTAKAFPNGRGVDLHFQRYVHCAANSFLHKTRLTGKVNVHSSQVNVLLFVSEKNVVDFQGRFCCTKQVCSG